ncbi:MAG: hypothetical protein IPI73_21975 [Betaproteobacteria bacterium]|nr:hypothetical protein [Betaproteobacteria bacterium]
MNSLTSENTLVAKLSAVPAADLSTLATMIDSGPLLPGFVWIKTTVAWEATRRAGNAGPFPRHQIQPNSISDAITAIWNLSAQFRGDIKDAQMSPIVELLNCAVANLRARSEEDALHAAFRTARLRV